VAQELTSYDPVCVKRYANLPLILAVCLAITTKAATLRYSRPNYRLFEPGPFFTAQPERSKAKIWDNDHHSPFIV
jgi:hypothetical protein